MLYPFDKSSLALTRHMDMLKGFHIEKIVSLKGWSVNEYNISPGYSIDVTEDFEQGLSCVDVVCILESWIEISFDQYIYPQVRRAFEEGKTVMLLRDLQPWEKDKLRRLKHGMDQLLFPNNPNPYFSQFLNLDTPVIAIGGYGQGMEKLDVELSLTREFRQMGYNPLLIASNPAASLMDEKFIPTFLFDRRLSSDEKIRALNYYVAKLDSDNQPDVIILGIPGAVVNNDPANFGDFGVTAFEIGQAIPIDEIVVLSPWWQYTWEYFVRLEEMVLGRLGAPVIAHALSKNTYDFSAIHEETKVTSLTVDEEAVEELTHKINYPKLTNLYRAENVKKLCEVIAEKYGTYAAIGRYS